MPFSLGKKEVGGFAEDGAAVFCGGLLTAAFCAGSVLFSLGKKEVGGCDEEDATAFDGSVLSLSFGGKENEVLEEDEETAIGGLVVRVSFGMKEKGALGFDGSVEPSCVGSFAVELKVEARREIRLGSKSGLEDDGARAGVDPEW